MSNTAKRQ